MYISNDLGVILLRNEAKLFATKAHAGQLRKSTKEAYITHPIRVAERLEDSGFSKELVAAGFLHDVVEDTPVTIEEIKRIFGDKVAAFVSAHTEDKSKSWKERKQHTIDTVKIAHKNVKYLIVADKLDNLQDVETSLNKQGNAIWDHFNAGYRAQKWYNESIAHNMFDGLEESEIPAYFETYLETVKRVFS